MQGRKRKGFTLVELILVIGLAALVGAVSAPALSSFLARGYFTDGVEKIVRTLRTAQNYSFSGKEDSSWGVHYEPGKLVLFKGLDYATRDPSFDAETNLPSAVVVTGWVDLSFERLRGLPSATPNILIEVLGRAGFVSVGAEGAINRP